MRPEHPFHRVEMRNACLKGTAIPRMEPNGSEVVTKGDDVVRLSSDHETSDLQIALTPRGTIMRG